MRTPRSLAAAAALLVAAAVPAAAQDTSTGVQPYRFTVEGYLAQYWLDTGVGDREPRGGFGARVMFNRSTPANATRTFFQRSTVGLYGTFTTESGVSSQNLGVQVDASLFPTAIAAGRLDPFVSLGAGILRTAVDVGDDDVSNTDLAIIPAVGTRIPFFSGIGFRGDLRAPIVFGDDTRVQWLAEGGLYISF